MSHWTDFISMDPCTICGSEYHDARWCGLRTSDEPPYGVPLELRPTAVPDADPTTIEDASTSTDTDS